METRPNSCVIVLGASSYPQCPELDNPSIAASAEALRQYFAETAELNVAPHHVLNLFGSPANATDQMLLVRRHLKDFEIQAGDVRKNVFLIYIGHGLIDEGHFSLSIAATDSAALNLTSLNIQAIANQLKTLAAWSRRFVILDCCYAAEALKQFLSNDGLSREAERAFESSEAHSPTSNPKRGTTVLCAADRYSQARAPREQTFTLFTGALLDVLNGGSVKAPRMMTFGNIFALVRAKLDKPGLPNPMLVSPDQTEGDLAQSLRLFPNSARSHSRTRRRLSTTSTSEAASTAPTSSDGTEIGNRPMRFAPSITRTGTHKRTRSDSSPMSENSPTRPWRRPGKSSYRWPFVADIRKQNDEREHLPVASSPAAESGSPDAPTKSWKRGYRWAWICLSLLLIVGIGFFIWRPTASTNIEPAVASVTPKAIPGSNSSDDTAPPGYVPASAGDPDATFVAGKDFIEIVKPAPSPSK